MDNITLDVTMELSKNEIVDNINKICEKNCLPLCLLNIIISNIAVEVNNMTQQELQNNMSIYLANQKEEKKDGENNEEN